MAKKNSTTKEDSLRAAEQCLADAHAHLMIAQSRLRAMEAALNEALALNEPFLAGNKFYSMINLARGVVFMLNVLESAFIVTKKKGK